MNGTGIVRRIDDLGRIVLPKEIRTRLHIRIGDPLEMFFNDEGSIILKKYSPDPEIKKSVDDLEYRFRRVFKEVGHKNSIEIIEKFKEIKKLWLDTEVEEGEV